MAVLVVQLLVLLVVVVGQAGLAASRQECRRFPKNRATACGGCVADGAVPRSGLALPAQGGGLSGGFPPIGRRALP